MVLSLHTRKDKSDWDYVLAADRNLWQRLAARTNGVITPANIISVAGLLLVIFGIKFLIDGNNFLGIWFILFGRLADILDGMIAERTKTKSKIGEATDIIIDKTAIVIVIGAIIFYLSIPWFVITFLIIQNLLSSIAGLYAYKKSVDTHATRSGKISTALSWMVLIIFLALDFFPGNVISGVAYMLFGIYTVIGTIAILEYAKNIIAAEKAEANKP